MNAASIPQVALVSVVDPNALHRSQVASALMSLYRVNPYPDAQHALPGLLAAPPNVLIVDEAVQTAEGADFLKSVRRQVSLAKVPIIFVSREPLENAQTHLDAYGVAGYLVKPYRRSHLIKTITGLINRSVEDRWEALPTLPRSALKSTVEVFNSISDVIASGDPLPFGVIREACSSLVDAVNKNDFKAILNGVKDHDNYSYAHSLRVATLLALFGHAAGIRGEEQQVLASGGLLHDAGKISIPHEILNKPGRLDEAEFAVMKSHVTETVKFLRTCEDIPNAVMLIAEQHHEKLDGKGYPHGLKAGELNELARMAAIVDVFSALTDRRVYKPEMEPEKALQVMSDEMTTHLDQHFLKLFKTMLLDAVL